MFDFDTAKFIELVNKSLNENNAEGIFYEVYDNEETDEPIGPKYIFLSPKQYRWLKNKYPEIFESYISDRSPDVDEIKEEK